MLDQKKVAWSAVEPNWKKLQIPVEPALYSQPVILEIEYTLAPAFVEGKRFFQTTLVPPVTTSAVAVAAVSPWSSLR